MLQPQDEAKKNLTESHTRFAIRQRLNAERRHSYLKDFVYGAIDGSVTTFAVVSGVAGAALSSKIIIVLGIANLLGDGFSMAVGNFLGTKSEQQQRDQARRTEEQHIEKVPEGEREEIRQIFAKKGFEGEALEKVVNIITSDKKQWVDTMVQEELGLTLDGPSPLRAALATFSAFVLVGFLPLLSFVMHLVHPGACGDPFIASAILTVISFFIIGALKAKYVGQSWLISGLETVSVGSIAAALAYFVGVGLKGIVT